MATNPTILVLGGTGKTGRRIVERLLDRDVTVRVGSRSGRPPFDWDDPSTWQPLLDGAAAAYLAYYPDLAVPGASTTVHALAEAAVDAGVGRLVLLSGRGEEQAEATEELVQDLPVDWTVLRCSWFCQNFSEGPFADAIRSGEVHLPSGDVPEAFVDADDIADVAVAALTESGHARRLYELTGPRLLTFDEAIAEIARALDRSVPFTRVPAEAYAAAMLEQGEPAELVELVTFLFTTVLDGRNASVADGVQQALGRPARDFYDYAWDAARAGAWGKA